MTKHVLIVDDEHDTADLMRLMFKTLGQETQSVGTGAEAIVRAHDDIPLMILLDLMLPDMPGWEVCAQLKRSPVTGHVLIVMLTARDDQDARDRANKAGADYFLPKPITRAQLREYLEHAQKHAEEQ